MKEKNHISPSIQDENILSRSLEDLAEEVHSYQQEEEAHKEDPIENIEMEKSGESEVQSDINPIQELIDKLGSYEELIKRQAADFDNFRKRSQEDKERIKDYALDSIFLDFLPIFDNIERALEASQKKDVNVNAIVTGLNGIIQLFQSFLDKHGLVKMDSVGEVFNPSLHEALFTQEGDYEQKTVIQEVEKAYKRKDKVIRTAKVAVGIPQKNQEAKEI